MIKTKKQIIEVIAKEVKSRFENEGFDHDWWHIHRVWTMAKRIARKEKSANGLIVELGALLHDVADFKFHGGNEKIGGNEARKIMKKHGVHPQVITEVCKIVDSISYKGAKVRAPAMTLEGGIVQDADRLDAIGAIGIARTFAYGGQAKRPLYNPAQKPVFHATKKAYINSKGTTINHFYEKLLLLKDRMNTKTGERIAKKRHRFMEKYLDQFMAEWNGRQ